MEVIHRGGRPVCGFGVGEQPVVGGGTVALASMMTGATAGLVAYMVKAPLWGSILVGTGAAIVTKWAIDRA